MNTINKRFKSLEDLNLRIFNEILAIVKAKNNPCFILSGGNSPKYLFKSISHNLRYFNQSTFLMSDERVVDYDDPNSNEGEFLRLSNVPNGNFVSLRDKKVIPKLSDASDGDQEVLGHLMLIAKDISNQLGLDETFRLVVNNGAKAGQSVFHLHIHLLSGRPLNWPPG